MVSSPRLWSLSALRDRTASSLATTVRWCRGLLSLLVAVSFVTEGRAQLPPNLQRQAFRPASIPGGATLFTKMDPAATGLAVQNPYDDPEMWTRRYREYMGGGMGSGVAAGDFDLDGNVDLYVSTKTKPGRLFRNLGNWKFVDVTEAAGLGEEGSLFSRLKGAVSTGTSVVWRQGAVFADVNNDGWPDLYVCRNNAPNLLYINRGDGTFTEEGAKRGLAVVDGSVVGAFADYDRDGWLDVLILTNQVDGTESAGRPDRLFHHNGDGTFTETTAKSGISGPTFGHAATWIDFDHDGWPDLYLCNDFAGADRLYRNNHDGTFTDVINTVAPHTSYSSMGADLVDFNHDGHLDLLVADMAPTTREQDRRGLVASRDDMITNSLRTDAVPQYMRNTLLLNTGTGVFREAACWAGLEATDWTWSVRFEDFDNDGWTDLHVTNGMVREANNSDVLTRMMGALSDAERINVMKRSPELAEANLAYRNLAGTGFAPVTSAWGLGEVGVSFGAATADLDGDGDLDLVYLNYNGGLSVFRNDVQGAHRVQIRLRGETSNRFGVGALLRIESATVGSQTQALTVARGYASGSELVAHFGLGQDRKIDRLVVTWPSGTEQVFTNLAADFAYVVTESKAAPPAQKSPATPLFADRTTSPGLLLKDESRPALPDREQIYLPFRTDRRGPAVAVADLDQDGHDDVFVGATTGSPARLLRWTGAAYQAEPISGLAPSQIEDGPALLFDVDGNGTRDLLITKASANASAWPRAFQPILYANDGHAQFTATDWCPDLPLNVGAACAADIDGDGDLDVFLGGRSVPGRYPETPQSLWLRNDGGRLVAVADQALGAVGLVKSAVFRDVDGDGRPDLVIATEWGQVRYFHNEGGNFAERTEQAGFASGGRGWWNSIASADFNGDGRPDFAVGNVGLNTTYRASPTQPAVLYSGDFAQNGTSLLVEAVYDGEVLYPRRGRNDLGARLPAVLRKFPKNDAYARAALKDVFGEQPLAQARRFEADNFSSGAFISQPDGSYRFIAFPRVAQIGPMQGLTSGDFNGDGRLDLCAVQNSDTAIPRFDGGVGLVLLGRGDGTFEAVSPEQSGVVVSGNGGALVLADASNSGRPDLFLTRHGGETKYLENQAPNVRWMKLQLAGGKMNPDAIGARVELVFSSQRSQFHELGLGGGWLSQAGPALSIAIPAGESLTAVRVTWPDGRTSRHTDIPAQGPWKISQPSDAR